ncbi:MAG TPA: hypothetical protein VH370_02090 [Humisphaera sp.]|nr:hypothetical protein [Humisphaera sp.]
MTAAPFRISFFVTLLLVSSSFADEAFFDLPLEKLQITAGKIPEPPQSEVLSSPTWLAMTPYVVLEGAGEALVSQESDGVEPAGNHLVIHLPAKRDVSGQIFLPKEDGSGMVAVSFKVPATEANDAARQAFYNVAFARYTRQMQSNAAGAAWFRRRAMEAGKFVNRKEADNLTINARATLDDIDLFSGNQALAENLQLDRLPPMRADRPGARTVEISSLAGITVAEIDWKPLIKDKAPALDPLANCIPADQHAIFFHDFPSMLSVADELDRTASPFLQMVDVRTEDAQTRQRYERQLGLSLSGLGRLLGPGLIKSLAVTGSDPYLRSGGDVAIIFEPSNLNVLQSLLSAQIALAQQRTPGAKSIEGAAGSIQYKGVQSPDHALQSFVAALNDHALVICNSLAELNRLADVQAGKTPALATLAEYTFFRDRYKITDSEESALIILSDATIRRWCGPRWRIADTRRTRAAAELADLNAKLLDRLVAGDLGGAAPASDWNLIDLGTLSLTPRGVNSTIYGRLDALTPISELNVDQVSEDEAAMYGRWRDTFQSNWRNCFDPIAIRLGAHGTKLAADFTVMPLIAGTEYRQFIELTRGAKIEAARADLHDSLVHIALAINPQSAPMRQAAGIAAQFAPNVKVDLLGWLGQSISIYADPDPFWDELMKAEKPDQFLEKNLVRLPVALRADVSSGFKLTAFLVALHAFIDQSAPGMTVWENLTYKDQAYVKISPSATARGQNKEIENAALYYLATGEQWLLTPSEALLRRAIDRQVERQAAGGGPPKIPESAQPILGSSLIHQSDAKIYDLFGRTMRQDFEPIIKQRAWSNLPILNEFKRRYPKEDPLKVYERFFQTKLVDPAGGTYTWNDRWQTMESTTCGCPAQPKPLPEDFVIFNFSGRANFGLTFEDQGLRARAELERARK